MTLLLGISLGLLLIFVIVLLITEVAANYPVWKHFNKSVFPFRQSTLAEQPKAGQLHFLRTVFIGIGFICFFSLAVVFVLRLGESAPALKEQTSSQKIQPKILLAHSVNSGIQFRLKTKWEDGKLYGNCTSMFSTDSVRPLTSCRLYLLDKDEFLIKAIVFEADDFVLEVSANGPSKKMVARFNTILTVDDYLKIEKLQVAVDGKASGTL